MFNATVAPGVYPAAGVVPGFDRDKVPCADAQDASKNIVNNEVFMTRISLSCFRAKRAAARASEFSERGLFDRH
jgi:hypothetical protein